ncbi:unnamed protein product [Globisporangium polare]
MQPQLVLATVALALCASSQRVEAYAKYTSLMPNGADVPDAPAVGHPDAEGMNGVNDFGKAFKKAGNAWTVALCQADTDGDGFTNGQELGDPCCTWTKTNTASLITDGISHPSDATKKPSNAKLIAGCSTSGTTATGTTGTSGNSSSSTPSTGGKETVNDVLAPVSATTSPTSSGKPADDDEDDSSESAVLSTATSGASVVTVAASAALVCFGALVAAF